jgi:hypothetical protein
MKMKSRTAARQEESARGHCEVDIFDPMDAVIRRSAAAAPPYPFAMHASALLEWACRSRCGSAGGSLAGAEPRGVAAVGRSGMISRRRCCML